MKQTQNGEDLFRPHHGKWAEWNFVFGVTNDLGRRAYEHRYGVVEGFTKKYGVRLLVYYEVFDDVHAAIHRETQLKKYKREWKLNLIQQHNLEWRDLAETLNN